ncbi:MAG: polysaccharide biosynthesis/export family protein [Pseudomonadota bacterium]|nr:polysaccharide biosynthesis/export family protein [Pseudomonadota bacterium]
MPLISKTLVLGCWVAGWACGCAGAAELTDAAQPRADAQETSAPGSGMDQRETAATVGDYLLQPGDVLQVSVWKETELTAEALIRPDGGLSYALAGELRAAGRTVAQLTAMLEQRIRKFEPDAVVTVAVKAAAGNRVYVIGKVTHPGDFPLNRPIDVMQALSLAGGATPFADIDSIRILRRTGNHQAAIAFRYGEVQRGHRLDQNILLQSGDTVVVP